MGPDFKFSPTIFCCTPSPSVVVYSIERERTMSNWNVVAEKIKHFERLAQDKYNLSIEPLFEVTRLPSGVAGMAKYNQNKIEISECYLSDTQESRNHIIENTIGHEYAHLLTWRIYGQEGLTNPSGSIRHHGREWKRVMRSLGLDPNRCHTLETPKNRKKRRKQTRWSVPCGDCRLDYELTTTMRNKMKKGYMLAAEDKRHPIKVCSVCRGKLDFSREKVAN